MTAITKEINREVLDMVSGGTFTPNTYKKAVYHTFGISTSYHFFCGDEFSFMGKGITYDMANKIVALGNDVSDAINEGQSGKDCIGFTEPAFIRAFNSQLLAKYGLVWDGVPGHDY